MVPIPSEISNHGHICARVELAGPLLSVGSWVLAEALILAAAAFLALVAFGFAVVTFLVVAFLIAGVTPTDFTMFST